MFSKNNIMVSTRWSTADKDTPIKSQANPNSCCFSLEYENNIVSKRRGRYIIIGNVYIFSNNDKNNRTNFCGQQHYMLVKGE